MARAAPTGGRRSMLGSPSTSAGASDRGCVGRLSPGLRRVDVAAAFRLRIESRTSRLTAGGQAGGVEEFRGPDISARGSDDPAAVGAAQAGADATASKPVPPGTRTRKVHVRGRQVVRLPESPRTPPVLVRQVRGGVVESRHRGSIVEVSVDGSVRRVLGDPDGLVNLRSVVKPFGLVALIEAGGVEEFDLSAAELAVMAGSHSGEDVHVRTLQAVFRRSAITQQLLGCGSEGAPIDALTAARLARDGEKPGPLRHMCSGQHASMLLLCRINGWPMAEYWRPDHQVQRLYASTVARAFATTPEMLVTSVDACGVPTYAFPLYEVARAFAMLADPAAMPESDSRATSGRCADPDSRRDAGQPGAGGRQPRPARHIDHEGSARAHREQRRGRGLARLRHRAASRVAGGRRGSRSRSRTAAGSSGHARPRLSRRSGRSGSWTRQPYEPWVATTDRVALDPRGRGRWGGRRGVRAGAGGRAALGSRRPSRSWRMATLPRTEGPPPAVAPRKAAARPGALRERPPASASANWMAARRPVRVGRPRRSLPVHLGHDRAFVSASRRAPPAGSTWARPGRRSSTSCSPATPAAPSSSASRTPTRLAPPLPSSRTSSTGCTGWGMTWDEGPAVGGEPERGTFGPYRQMERLPRYREAADRLLAEDKAYHCYCTSEELDAERKRRRRPVSRPTTTAVAPT